MKQCPACDTLFSAKAEACPECGTVVEEETSDAWMRDREETRVRVVSVEGGYELDTGNRDQMKTVQGMRFERVATQQAKVQEDVSDEDIRAFFEDARDVSSEVIVDELDEESAPLSAAAAPSEEFFEEPTRQTAAELMSDDEVEDSVAEIVDALDFDF